MIWGAGRLLWRAFLARKTLERPRWLHGGKLLPLIAVIGLLASSPGLPRFTASTSRSPTAAGESAVGGAGRFGDELSLWKASVAVSGPVRALELPAPPAKSKRTALIIGIDRAAGGRPLPGSVTDAKNIRDALLAYGFPKKNITMLLDGAATKSAIRRELADLSVRTPKDGVAVFAVATHTRKRNGHNEFLTADGGRIGAPELATALGRVPSKMWVALPTCYAAGYALPGIVGKGRVATFASPATQPTYQLGNAGSYLVINMVREGMLRGHAAGSVEEAFHFARAKLERTNPTRVPMIDDGVTGELVLGRVSKAMLDAHERSVRAEAGDDRHRVEARGQSPDADDASETAEDPSDASTEPLQQKAGVGVCAGRFHYRCSKAN